MKLLPPYVLLAFSLLGSYWCAPPNQAKPSIDDLESYEEMDWDKFDLNNYGDYGDYEEIKIEISTVAPRNNVQQKKNKTSTPVAIPSSVKEEVPSVTLDFKDPGLFGPQTSLNLPTCLLCVCIGSSVYCDDLDLDKVPPLPKSTAYFYARFNKIEKIHTADFQNLNRLKTIDLTGNQISEIEVEALHSLSDLQELRLSENKLWALPEIPVNIRYIDARQNQLVSTGIRPEAFKDLSHLQFLYLSNNKLDFIPIPLPEALRVLHLQHNNIQTLHVDTFCKHSDMTYVRRALEDIRLDGNPINLSHFPHAYFCLPRLPTGNMQ
ncbi:opticin [Erpetoichthys calabaricus]|nr:opticin [Erpetoichthys calabaricus]XP_051780523.1 opticin [Erpetoichthys calabaricus]